MNRMSMAGGIVGRETQRRGSWDTPGPGWVAVHSARASNKKLVWMLLASFGLHLALSPFPALLRLLALYKPAEVVDEEPVNGIPLEFLEDAPAPEPPKPPAEEPAVNVAKGSEPAATKDPDAPKTQPAAAPKPPKSGEEEGAKDPKNPVKMAGLAGGIADSNANVQLLLHMEAIRASGMGTEIGDLLTRIPQWSDFFGESDINPVRDLDHMLVSGPQFRNSKNVVVVLQHHLKRQAIEGVLDGLVNRGGEWLEKKKIARAKVDRAERVFSIASRNVVAMGPLSAEASIRKFPGKTFRKPEDNTAVTAYVKEPYKAGKSLPVRIPDSIAWAFFAAREVENGAVEITINAEDASEDMASQNAHQIEHAVNALIAANMGSLGERLFGKVRASFESEGKMIHGKLKIPRGIVALGVQQLDAFLPEAVRKPSRTVPATTPETQETAPSAPADPPPAPSSAPSETAPTTAPAVSSP